MDITDAEVIQAVKTIKKYCRQEQNKTTTSFPCYRCLLQKTCYSATDFIAAAHWPVPKIESVKRYE